MPLVRKPTERAAAAKPDPAAVLSSLASTDPQQRWAAARAAAEVAGGAAALAHALATEEDPRVREAMFTSLVRIGTPQSADSIVALLRSDNASARTAALDALRIMSGATRELLPRLLADADVDVRILSCELARSLPNSEATSLMSALLETETNVNVCAAAVDVLAEVGSAEALPSLAACARRHRDSPFLEFAIEAVVERIASQSHPPRA